MATKKKIFENEKFSWYVTEETQTASIYAKAKGLKDIMVSQAEDKTDGRLEYVVLKADEEGSTEAVFASSAIKEVLEYIDSLGQTQSK